MSQRPFSDPQAAIATASKERPLLADSRHWCSDRSSDGEGSFSDENRTLQIRLLLRAKRTKSAQKRTFPLQENFYLKRSEFFGPYLEKHFRKDARYYRNPGLVSDVALDRRDQNGPTKKFGETGTPISKIWDPLQKNAAKSRITIPDHPYLETSHPRKKSSPLQSHVHY